MKAFLLSLAMPAVCGFASFASAAPTVVGNVDLIAGESFHVGRAAVSSSEVVAAGATYSNVTNFLGSGGINGGFATGSTPTATTFSNMVFDDLTTTGGNTYGTFRFSLANFNTTAQSLLPSVRFYTDSGTGPGTFISGFDFNGVTVNASSISILTFAATGSSQFTLPSGRIWAGVAFRGNGVTTAAVANNFGQGLFNPVNVGTSADLDYNAAAAGGPFTAANPAGTLRTAPFAAPLVANYGWEFVPVPEPTGLALLGLGAAGLIARRRKA